MDPVNTCTGMQIERVFPEQHQLTLSFSLSQRHFTSLNMLHASRCFCRLSSLHASFLLLMFSSPLEPPTAASRMTATAWLVEQVTQGKIAEGVYQLYPQSDYCVWIDAQACTLYLFSHPDVYSCKLSRRSVRFGAKIIRRSSIRV
jgi:hypothetical protein